MILIDMNQVMISNLMVHLNTNTKINEGLVRFMILNSLRMYRSKFSKDYGELVLCYDSKQYWRKVTFPYYKGTRKKDREKSQYNWTEIFELLNKLRDEFTQNLPYPVLTVDGSEADDIIAVLCKYQSQINLKLQKDMQPVKKVLILSGDKDFIQLQKYSFVTQYNPIQKKYVTQTNPHKYVAEHTLKGDRSDGIPNFLSDDDTFIEGKRQKPLTKRNIEKWSAMSPEDFCFTSEQLRRYNRNRELIDFSCIPKHIEESIIDRYETIQVSSRKNLLDYFSKNNLSELLNTIGEF